MHRFHLLEKLSSEINYLKQQTFKKRIIEELAEMSLEAETLPPDSNNVILTTAATSVSCDRGCQYSAQATMNHLSCHTDTTGCQERTRWSNRLV